MRSLRTAILWITGILLWTFALSIGLAWLDFGYLDVRTAVSMGLMLLPLLGIAAGILAWTRAQESAEEKDLAQKPPAGPAPEPGPAATHGKASVSRGELRLPAEDHKTASATSTSSITRKNAPIGKGDSK